MPAGLEKILAKGANYTRDITATGMAGLDTLAPFLPAPLVNAIKQFFGFGPARDSYTDINKFRSHMNGNNGMMRSNHFYVEIPPPRMLSGELAATVSIPLLCEAANLPGVSLATSEIRRYGYGPIERKPYAPIFTDQNFTFLGDGTGTVHRFFYKWMNGIIKMDRAPYATSAGYNGLNPFEVEYKVDYSTDIKITAIDEANRKVIICTLHEAYPLFLGDIAMSWSDNDSLMRVPVSFTYFNWSLEEINVSELTDIPGQGGLSLFQKILKAGTAIQTLATIRKPTGIADVVNIVGNSKIAIGGMTGIWP